MRVILIFPESPQGSVPVEMPSPGLAYIKAYLISKGIFVKVVDLTFPEPELDSLVEKSDYVGVYVNESVLDQALLLALRFKHKTLVAGGPYASIGHEALLDYFDHVIVGEGEKAFYELVSGKKVDSIKGLAYKDSKVRYNPCKPVEETLPFPDYKGLPLERHVSCARTPKKGL